MASSPQRRLHGMLLLSTVLSVGSFAPCRAQPTSIATFQDLLAALASTDAAEIGLTEELLTSAEGWVPPTTRPHRAREHTSEPPAAPVFSTL